MPFMTGMMMSRSTKLTLSGILLSSSRAVLPFPAIRVSYLSQCHSCTKRKSSQTRSTRSGGGRSRV